MPDHTQRPPLLLSIGSNYHTELNIPMALEQIEQAVCVLVSSPPLRTRPINFPHPSPDFINLLIYAESHMSLNEVVQWSKALELNAGRNEQLRRDQPQFIPLDIDIVLWGDALLRPQDLQRYYMPKALALMGFSLVSIDGKHSLQPLEV